MWIIDALFRKVDRILLIISGLYLGVQIALFVAERTEACSTKSPNEKNKMFIDIKELFTRYSTLFTTAVAGFAFYWINVMDEATKVQVMDFVGPYGKWITPIAAYLVWLGLRAKKQGD